jgi:hypothetical protein
MNLNWIKDGFNITNDTFVRHLSIGVPSLASTKLLITNGNPNYTIKNAIKAHGAMTLLGFLTLNLTSKMMNHFTVKNTSFAEKEQEIFKKSPIGVSAGLLSSLFLTNKLLNIYDNSKNKEKK